VHPADLIAEWPAERVAVIAITPDGHEPVGDVDGVEKGE